MKKRYWKDRARREVEDKRKNWAPIKIAHPYTPRDAGCMLCDDPPEDPRHAAGRPTVAP